MSVLVISPHLDDAVLSCGQLLAAHPDSKIVTIMAGVPKSDLPLTKFDHDSGFTSAREAVIKRRQEDFQACAVLGAEHEHYDVLDRQYGVDANPDTVCSMLEEVIDGHEGDIFVPLGLLHPDHELVARLARVAVVKHKRPQTVHVYGELPGWVIRPLELEPTLNRVRTEEHWRLEPAPDLSQSSGVEIKRAAAACYRSQAWAIPDRWYMVPELYWRASFAPEG